MTVCLSPHYQYLFNLNQKSLNGLWPKTSINIEELILDKTESPKKRYIKTNSISRQIRNGESIFFQVRNEIKFILSKNYKDDHKLSNLLFDIVLGTIDQIVRSGKIKESDVISLPIRLTKKIIEYYPIKYVNRINHMKNEFHDKSKIVLSTCFIKCYDYLFFDREINDLLKDNVKKGIIHVVGCPILVLIYKDSQFDKFETVKYNDYSNRKVGNQSFGLYNLNQILSAQNITTI